MLYYRCNYENGLFLCGRAYFRAKSLSGVRRQMKREPAHFNLSTLRRISRRTYQKAREEKLHG